MSDKFTEMVHEHLRAENHSCSAKFADELHQSAMSMLHHDHCKHLSNKSPAAETKGSGLILDLEPKPEVKAGAEPFLGFGFSDGSSEPAKFNHNGIIEETPQPVTKVNEHPPLHHEPESEWSIGINYRF